jgi:hypothetical protein
VKDPWLVASYAISVIGFILFAEIYNLHPHPRLTGFLFVALVGMIWIWRAMPGKSVPLVWLMLLLVNAVGGLTTLSSELRPYSQGREVARWLDRNNLQEEFVIGSRDVNVSAVAGYLQRPIYYLESKSFGTYVKWSKARIDKLSQKEFLARVAGALESEHKTTAIVIVKQPFDLSKQQLVPDLAFEALQRFSPALKHSETYDVYRVTKQGAH